MTYERPANAINRRAVRSQICLWLERASRSDVAAKLLAEIGRRDATSVEGLRKQLDAVWGVLDRADGVLREVAAAMVQVKPGSEAAELIQEIDFARELIASARAHR